MMVMPILQRGFLRQWLAVTRVSLGASRLVITIPIYVLMGAVALMPLGFLLFLALPFHPQLSIFDSFLGDFLSAPQGMPQRAASYFYFYLYLMSYLSIASIIGYEERRDRSIMFWKSLPIGDGLWILGQITALFVAFGIGLAALTMINTVITVWETVYFVGLNYSNSDFMGNFSRMAANMVTFSSHALLILFLSLPFGVSMLWFATFCKRQPGGYWLGTFVSIYLLAFLLRYIGFDQVEPLLWYPESFGRITYSLLAFNQLPEQGSSVSWMAVIAVITTTFFGLLTWHSRRKAMPVS